jgi:hypothetical protein
MIEPPGNSLAADQQQRVADAGPDLATGLRNLLQRVEEELQYNAAKGTSPYRMGMQDGLHFARDAIAALLGEPRT